MSTPTREVELKARVEDVDASRRNIEHSGAVLVYDGELSDRIYDTSARALAAQDIVLRLRTYRSAGTVSAHLDWKGPTSRENGFKVRAELTSGITDPGAIAAMLTRLGYAVVRAIDRHIVQYELSDADAGTAVIRFERYPRMDLLVEVEGSPSAIEHAVGILGIPRRSFSADRLVDFVAAFEARTGETAIVAQAEAGTA